MSSEIPIKSRLAHTLLGIVLGIVGTVAVRYGADYTYSKLRSEGLTPKLPYAKERDGRPAPVDVYLIPFDGFPEAVAGQIAAILSYELNINIQTSLAIPIDGAMYNSEREQYLNASLYEPIAKVVPLLKNGTDRTVYIGLLDADMYPEQGDWNYLFLTHWAERISVVATGRLIPYAVFRKEEAAGIYGQRLLKLVKRTIGQQYFGMARSSDRRSVMYSPLLGTQAMDEMGYEFLTTAPSSPQEQQRH